MENTKLRRTDRLALLLTPEEDTILRTAAAQAGVPVSTWVRMVALAAARASETEEANVR